MTIDNIVIKTNNGAVIQKTEFTPTLSNEEFKKQTENEVIAVFDNWVMGLNAVSKKDFGENKKNILPTIMHLLEMFKAQFKAYMDLRAITYKIQAERDALLDAYIKEHDLEVAEKKTKKKSKN